jgi:hypothetical protein
MKPFESFPSFSVINRSYMLSSWRFLFNVDLPHHVALIIRWLRLDHLTIFEALRSPLYYPDLEAIVQCKH